MVSVAREFFVINIIIIITKILKVMHNALGDVALTNRILLISTLGNSD